MKFVHFLSGWGGSAADATMYAHSRLVDLTISQASFILLMQGLGSVIHYWSHIVEFITTLQSGDKQI